MDRLILSIPKHLQIVYLESKNEPYVSYEEKYDKKEEGKGKKRKDVSNM